MSRRTMKAAAAAAVAAVALAGCGGSAKVGAAALVGDDRITVSRLNEAVSDWQREFRADATANRMRASAEPLPESDMRNALHLLVRFRVGDEVARRNGVSISEGRIDEVVSQIDQEGGTASFVRSRGLPGRHARDMARLVAVEDQMTRRFGATADPRSPQTVAAGERAMALFVDAARGMKIKINPRFGDFDPSRVDIGPVKYTLSAPESGIR